jgi:hypothetical protein
MNQVLSSQSVRRTLLHPAILTAAAIWAIANIAVISLSGGVLPFDRPKFNGLSIAAQLAMPSAWLIEILAFMVLVAFVTRRRVAPDMAARAPAKSIAGAEVFGLVVYAIAGQAGGWVLGPALGYRPFSFHVAGTVFGCSVLPSPGEIVTWMSYNFIIFALIPFLWFHRRYSALQLNLRSVAPRADFLLIVVIMLCEGAFELTAFPGLLSLSGSTIVRAAPLAFVIYFFGTVLPTMVLIYSILLPRYWKLTGSQTVTLLLGGLSYAAMHLVEGWSNFSTLRDSTLSLLFVFLTYFGPGLFKTFVTLRTGNAWVHALGYHAVAPHVIADTPLIAEAFALL